MFYHLTCFFNNFCGISALVGSWSFVFIRRIIYTFLTVCPSDYKKISGSQPFFVIRRTHSQTITIKGRAIGSFWWPLSLQIKGIICSLVNRKWIDLYHTHILKWQWINLAYFLCTYIMKMSWFGIFTMYAYCFDFSQNYKNPRCSAWYFVKLYPFTHWFVTPPFIWDCVLMYLRLSKGCCFST